ncbi:FtsH protease activity modulator HflK [Paracoccus aerodenitrificans]|uniref:FtsH protease activity modulator HflK n=1 Tax=Paracoccus aerodenitrificans TaxID=3017781 RepID=UPI0022F00DFA|nr:FtsH protease activity modulator HflK [Paracoccus aerodenitrificans]WBU65237.1 FtsH protease activity modulator HflK [Paracoccus aerodenitrificans]
MAQGPWGGGSSGGNGSGGKGGNEPPRGPQRPWGQGGNQGDPGKQRPEPPRRPGQRPGDMPEIEELMKKGQDRLRVLMGGRGSGNNNNGGGPRRPRGSGFRFDRRMLIIGGLVVVGMWTAASFYTVRPEERSVEFLFGRAVGTGEPGLNFAPWPVVTKEVVQVTGERVTEIGSGRVDSSRSSSGSGSAIATTDSGLMLTRDQNIVDMEYQVVWNISDPEKYLFNLADPSGTIRAVAESSMRDIIARSELAPILNRDRGAIAEDLKLSVQQTLDSYESGVNVIRVNLDRADPPGEVIDAFRKVQAAQQRRDALEKQADAYANQVLAQARGDAAAAIEQAEGYRAEAVNNAQGESARFNSVYAEYAKAPEVTRKRMYLETMERVLGSVDKVIIEDSGSGGVVPYLPLDQLRRQGGQGPSSGNNGGNAGAAPSSTAPSSDNAASMSAITTTTGGSN